MEHLALNRPGMVLATLNSIGVLLERTYIELQEASLKEAMYRGPSASSLANSASSTDTLVGSGTNPASASAPDLPSKAQGGGLGFR